MRYTLLLLLFLSLPFYLIADGNNELMRIYRDKSNGEIDYLLVDKSNINYIQWQESEGRLLIVFQGGHEYIKVKTEAEAIKIAEDIYDSNVENWINYETEVCTQKKKQHKARKNNNQIPF